MRYQYSVLGLKKGAQVQPKKTTVNIWVEIEGENPGGRERFTGETEETGE